MTEDEAREKVNELLSSSLSYYHCMSTKPDEYEPLKARRDALIAEVVAGLVKPAAPMDFGTVYGILCAFSNDVQRMQGVERDTQDLERMARAGQPVAQWVIDAAHAHSNDITREFTRSLNTSAATICGGTFESGRFVPGKGEGEWLK